MQHPAAARGGMAVYPHHQLSTSTAALHVPMLPSVARSPALVLPDTTFSHRKHCRFVGVQLGKSQPGISFFFFCFSPRRGCWITCLLDCVFSHLPRDTRAWDSSSHSAYLLEIKQTRSIPLALRTKSEGFFSHKSQEFL